MPKSLAKVFNRLAKSFINFKFNCKGIQNYKNKSYSAENKYTF